MLFFHSDLTMFDNVTIGDSISMYSALSVRVVTILNKFIKWCQEYLTGESIYLFVLSFIHSFIHIWHLTKRIVISGRLISIVTCVIVCTISLTSCCVYCIQEWYKNNWLLTSTTYLLLTLIITLMYQLLTNWFSQMSLNKTRLI